MSVMAGMRNLLTGSLSVFAGIPDIDTFIELQ